MIWYKTWLESRLRFFVTALVLVFVVSWAILNCDHAMARFDRKPPITFTQYVWHVYAGGFQAVWVASVLFLGLGGLVRERALGTAQYTLSMPVSRMQWMAVRATVGIVESAVLAAIPVVVIPLMASLVGRSYPVWEALKYSALLFAMGVVFFCAGLLYSSILPGELAAAAVGLVSLYFAFTAYDYLYRWFPYFSMSGLLSGADFVDRSSGFLDGWPWLATLICLAVAASFYIGATHATKHLDF